MLRILSVCVLVAVTAGLVGAQEPVAPPAAAADDWMPTEIKNLTVLPKDMGPADVMRIMRAWNEALKVDCVFCHVGTVGKPLSTFDFASDNKPRKETSRVMLRAVMDMNEKFKTIESDEPPSVMCSTCHKRSRHVDADLPPAEPKPAAQQ
jgi:hypothetical protein